MADTFRDRAEQIAGYIGLFLIQTVIGAVLYFLAIIFSWFFHYVITGTIVFSLYAVSWWVVWSIQYTDAGILRFYPKLISATVPLAAFTAFYIWSHPTPNYTVMIPVLPVDIHFFFAAAVTGTALFPLYSIALAKFVLPNGFWRPQSIGAASVVAAIGAALFDASFRLLPHWW